MNSLTPNSNYLEFNTLDYLFNMGGIVNPHILAFIGVKQNSLNEAEPLQQLENRFAVVIHQDDNGVRDLTPVSYKMEREKRPIWVAFNENGQYYGSKALDNFSRTTVEKLTSEALKENTIYGQINAKFTAKVAKFVYALISIFSLGIVNLVNYVQTKRQKASVKNEVSLMNMVEKYSAMQKQEEMEKLLSQL